MPNLPETLSRPAIRLKRRLDRLMTKSPVPRVFELPNDEELLGSLTPGFRSIADVMTYLCMRRTPRFFIQANEIQRALAVIERDHPAWRRTNLRQAAEMADLHLPIFGRDVGLSSSRDWQALPLGPGADVLYVQQLHRFAFAPRLALAALYGAPSRATLRSLMTGWVAATYGRPNPIAYGSAHLTTHRMLALCWTLAFLQAGQASDDGLEALIFKVLLCDLNFIAECQPSATPNNHSLAESFALWFYGTLFPEFADSLNWRLRGQQDFLAQLERQIYPDGTSFEHSIHYQEQACELVLSYVLLSRRNGLPVASWVIDRARAMLNLQIQINGPEGRTLALGSMIEVPLFPLDAGFGDAPGAWRILARALFDRHVAPPWDDDASVEKGFWLLGGQMPSLHASKEGSPPVRCFPDGGYYRLAEAGDESRVIFRSGPVEGAVIAPGHMQADLLSVYLTLEATPVVVASGTYTYRSDQINWPLKEPNWRRHFVGPGASNGLVIEGVDPLARRPGDFPGGARGDIKSRVAVTHRAVGERLTWIEGEVRGETLYSGHGRAVVHVAGCYWVVIDRLPRDLEGRRAALHFQLAPEAQVEALGEGAQAVRCGAVCLEIAASAGLAGPEVVAGATDPPAGWVSPSYGVKLAAPLLRYGVAEGTGTCAVVLAPGRSDAKGPAVELLEPAGGGLGLRITRGDTSDILLLAAGREHGIEAFGMTFHGHLMWLRCRSGRPVELRWLSGTRLSAPDLSLKVAAARAVAELRLDSSPSGLSISGAGRDDLTLTWP